MNSPFNALTVFTKFMSSPTDALEIISKIVSSPQDVLQFIKNLMDSPEEGLEIMNKFMNTPAEALKIINKIFNGNNAASTSRPNESINNELLQDTIIKSTALLAQSQSIAPISILDEGNQKLTPPHEMQNSIINSMLTPSPELSSIIATSPIRHTEEVYSPISAVQTSVSASSTPPSDRKNITSTNPALVENNLNSYSLKQPILDSQNTVSNSVISSNYSVDNLQSPQFQASTFQPNFSTDSYINGFSGDSLNSLESVLSEVIRIEYQAFNNLPPETRIKQEQHAALRGQQIINNSSQTLPVQSGCYSTNSGFNNMTLPNQHHQIEPTTSNIAMGRVLNDTEQMKLRELKLASEALYLPVDEDLSVLMDDRIKVSCFSFLVV